MTINEEIKRAVDIGWAAGFFCGEGSIFTVWTLRKSGKRYPYCRLNVCNTFLPNLENFSRIVGGDVAIYNVGRSQDHYKDRYYFATNKWGTVRDIITLLWPYLCKEKRDQAFEAFNDYLTEDALDELLLTLKE